jgi:hypothetical protein
MLGQLQMWALGIGSFIKIILTWTNICVNIFEMRLSCVKSALFRYHVLLILLSTSVFVYLIFDHIEFYIRDDMKTYNDFSLDVIIETHAPTRFAVISTSLVDKPKFYYMLYIPMCALAWRRIGYEPLVLIVRNRQLSVVSQVSNKTIQYLNRFNIRIVYVEAPVEYVNQLGMLARIFTGGLPDDIVRKDDFVIISDSDLIPVSKSYFNFYNTKAITILNAFNIGTVEYKNKQYDMYPMAYIGMRKWQWQEVMNLSRTFELNGEMIMTRLREIHGPGQFRKNAEVIRGDDVWYLDQRTVTILINDFIKEDNVRRKLNKYKFTGIRLDRSFSASKWYGKLRNFENIIDCHMYHAEAKLKINLIMRFLEKLFNKNICDQLTVYFAEFFAIIG